MGGSIPLARTTLLATPSSGDTLQRPDAKNAQSNCAFFCTVIPALVPGSASRKATFLLPTSYF